MSDAVLTAECRFANNEGGNDAPGWCVTHGRWVQECAGALRLDNERLARVLIDLCDDLEGRFADRFIAHNDPYAIALGERTFEARRALSKEGK